MTVIRNDLTSERIFSPAKTLPYVLHMKSTGDWLAEETKFKFYTSRRTQIRAVFPNSRPSSTTHTVKVPHTR